MMGKRGPSKTPTKLALVKGERPDRINTNEPVPSSTDLAPPDHLEGAALEVWHRLAPDLIAKGVLTAWDTDSFAVLCQAVAHHREAVIEARRGVLVNSARDDGAKVKNPAMQLVRDTASTIRMYAQEFGLTPSARTGLTMPEVAHDGSDLLTG